MLFKAKNTIFFDKLTQTAFFIMNFYTTLEFRRLNFVLGIWPLETPSLEVCILNYVLQISSLDFCLSLSVFPISTLVFF